MALPPVAASIEDAEDTCPVCYESIPLACSGLPAAVSCKVCNHAVCGECDEMLTRAGHMRCPMCRAPAWTNRPLPPLRMAMHAFHCADTACERPYCTDAKLLLLRMSMHVQKCATRELRGADECKVCKLWRGASPHQTLCSTSGVETVGVSELPLPPEQVKHMLLSHVRQCRNQRCDTCRKLRDYIWNLTQAVAS